ncbi:protein of unknown function (plasmid) [Cupriavidus neocaledonicus]|uniref:Transposase n=1 Tax=Cupriavidus neocaledonicus TaxID=1040979 RepID=A0A375HRX0_9BURK|nr:protein of unknown function [Cupriavidus neocaledonicus]
MKQYFQKGTDLSVYSQAEFNAIARRLNERPRKALMLFHFAVGIANSAPRDISAGHRCITLFWRV